MSPLQPNRPKKAKPKEPWKWPSLLRLRAIVLYRVYASLLADKEKTYVGSIWFFLEPILSAAGFLVVSHFIRHREDHFIVFVIIGSICWQFFASTVGRMADSINRAKPVIECIYIQKWVFPVADLIFELVHFICALAALLVGMSLFGYLPGLHVAGLPAVFLVHVILCAGIGLPVAALIPMAPDFKEVIRAGLRMLGLISGIFFSASLVPQNMQFWFYLNPMAHLLDAYRAVLLFHHWPTAWSLAYPLMLGTTGILLGVWLIHRFDRAYPKLIL